MSDTWCSMRWTACALLILGLTACGSSSGDAPAAAASGHTGAAIPAEETKEEDAIAVRTAAITRDSLSELYATTATLRAEKIATVTARTEGVVQQLLVEEGDNVRAGQALAVLENEEQKIAFEREQTTTQNLEREFQRAESLHEQGLLSDEAYETSRRSAKEARHSADLAQLQLERTTIRAPFSGRVLQRHIDLGVTVGNGTAVYELADLDPLYADISVPERHVGRLSVGQQVRLAADSFDLTTVAKIERIAPRVDTETGTVKVTLAVNGQARLRPGTFVRAEVVIDTHTDTLVVKRSALVPEGRRWHLYRLDDTGTHVQRVEVQRGFEEGEFVEVSASDPEQALNSGDPVVVVGASALSDGVRVDTGPTETADIDGAGSDAS